MRPLSSFGELKTATNDALLTEYCRPTQKRYIFRAVLFFDSFGFP